LSEELDGSVDPAGSHYPFYLLYQVGNRAQRVVDEIAESAGVSGSKWRALAIVNRLGACTMNELAEFTAIDRTTLTRSVDSLVAQGWVTRGADANDRRVVRVQLTDAGREVFRRVRGDMRDYNRWLLDGLSDEDQRQLRALLQRLLRRTAPDPQTFERLLHFK
jgi:DNA-binding MarR family transcriptional regulator